MRDKNGTTQHTAVERIGELAVMACAKGSMVELAVAVATDFDVEIEFRYTPGDAGNLSGRFEDAVEPTPAELDIRAIRAADNVLFDGEGVTLTAVRGHDLLPLFSHYQITALEDKLLARATKGEVE